jgi:glycosyltransferase involved in cell wall biosynthesis
MKFSFIIPTLNEERYIEACLKSIRKQTKKNYEIILVDSYSKDRTIAIAKRYRTKLLFEKRRGPAVARNKGAEKAKGDVFIFCDADVRFQKEFLEKIEKEFSRGIGGAIFNLKVYDSRNSLEKMGYSGANNIAKFLNRLGIAITAGSCLACRSDIFRIVKGYNPAFLTNEDHDLAKKINKIKRFEFFSDITVLTSSRRVKRLGFFRSTKMYFKSTLLFFFKNSYLRDYWQLHSYKNR